MARWLAWLLVAFVLAVAGGCAKADTSATSAPASTSLPTSTALSTTTTAAPSTTAPPTTALTATESHLTAAPGDEQWPSWCSDADRVVYRFETSNGATQGLQVISVAAPAAGAPTIITSDLALSSPDCGPDGRVVYNFENEPGIWVVGMDGSNPAQLTAEGWAPAWSPDGSRIAFGFAGDDWSDIYVMKADGSNPTRLRTETGGGAPAWSPDGARIAWSSGTTLFDGQICVMDADGANQACLATDGVAGHPTWSPDGTRIAFALVTADGGNGNSDIWVMGADGTAVTRLTDDPGWDTAPDWSPDGTTIAFATDRYGNWDIWLLTFGG